MNKTTILLAILPFLFLSCKDKEQQAQSLKSTTTEISKDTLFTFEIDGQYFFATSRNVADVMVIGVTHNDAGLDAGVDPIVLKNYEKFWDFYLESTRKDPSKIKVGIETGIPVNMPQAKIGDAILLSQPHTFITSYLFNLGLRKIIITDPRDKSPQNTERFVWGLYLFEKRGGVISIDSMSVSGFPVARVQKEPALTSEDIRWLNDEWYENCHLANEAYEKVTYDLAHKGVMSVVGAVHALQLHKKYGVDMALIVTDTDLSVITESLAETEYLSEIIE